MIRKLKRHYISYIIFFFLILSGYEIIQVCQRISNNNLKFNDYHNHHDLIQDNDYNLLLTQEKRQVNIVKGNMYNIYVDKMNYVYGNKDNVEKQRKSFFLSAVITVRIYEKDKAKWTRKELEQWIQYMKYAGVEHFYLYDNYKFLSESLEKWCREKYSTSVLTYHNWSYHPHTIKLQEKSYQHAIENYRNMSLWQIAFDMDEYPFAKHDIKTEFLKRFLKKQIKLHPDVSEFDIQNFLFLGKPRDKTNVIERFIRRTPTAANDLVKPIYKPKCIVLARIHRNLLKCGRYHIVEPDILRINHYWGGRLQNWGNDTPEVLKMTKLDNSASQIAQLIYS